MFDLSTLSDDEVTERLGALVATDRRRLAEVLAHIGEFNERRLHEPKGFVSCFVYCTKVLGYSEGEAYRRINAARLARTYPSIFRRVHRGVLNLTALTILAPHLTPENHRRLMDGAAGKSRIEVEALVAAESLRPDQPDFVRRLPTPGGNPFPAPPLGSGDPAPSGAGAFLPEPLHPRQSLHPSAPNRVRFAFTGSSGLLGLLRRAQEILKHKYPAGNLELIFQEALEILLDKKDPQRRLRLKRNRGKGAPDPIPAGGAAGGAAGRRIPQWVRDAVWRRDGGQCVQIVTGGERCPERGGLEFDHIVPYGLGGASNNPGNIRLLCRTHNQMLARAVFGPEKCAPRRTGPAVPA